MIDKSNLNKSFLDYVKQELTQNGAIIIVTPGINDYDESYFLAWPEKGERVWIMKDYIPDDYAGEIRHEERWA